MNKYEILKNNFGFDHFKPLQEEAIDHILAKKDLLTILPTGSGKSLIFQVPTLMMSGVTIVISPLVALMQDQVMNLKSNGVNAVALTSLNSNEQNDILFQQVLNNEVKFLYVAPERFVNEYFINQLRKIDINFFVIDEAHCVSEWGHEFRDDYRKLQYIKQNFPNTNIAAFTATATASVQDDILDTLGIDRSNLLKSKIQRTNLLIQAKKRLGNGKEQIKQFLNTHKDECGIVYCFTRKETETLSSYLNKEGFSTLAYHAGLPSGTRDDIFNAFKNEDIKIIVATIAFGMGIDKSNIRFVLHTSMPKTLENYSQEIGRAGRDGLNADVLMLYSKSDEISKQKFIDDLPNGVYKSNNYKKLNTMYRFCVSSKCRHKNIAKYFDDEINSCETICDNCTRDDIKYQDITIDSQKFISAILRCEERFGLNYIVDVLKGSKNKRLLDFGHNNLSVYGIGDNYSKEQWSSIADVLFDIEAINIQGEYRTLSVTQIGKEILKKELTVQIDENNLTVQKEQSNYKQSINTNENFELFRELRKKISQDENVAPYMIFSDKTLIEISNTLPTSNEQFLNISGVGQLKLDKYANPFISLCKEQKKDGIITTKTLSKTYLQTLDCIENNLNIEDISQQRELKELTIIGHINELYTNNYISNDTKEKLYEPLKNKIPNNIIKWIEEGLSITDINTLRQNLSLYSYIQM
jgi:ATP-dependent DNA helicase RecQ